jgi:predicted short-subunit dehydrogenase-like oxidoreductase (DUF2520 family)
MDRKRSRPRVALIGAGNLGTALGVALHAAGYEIEQIVIRGASSRRVKRLARAVHAPVVVINRAKIRADVVWFCVPDAAIANAADSLARAATDWKEKIALHSSGALGGRELKPVRRAGAAVAAVHPLMTFVRGSRPSLAGVPFSLEGDARAVRVARALVADLGGVPFGIQERRKAAYHAWGMFLSPLLAALLGTSERVAAAAGIGRKSARERMQPIVKQTLANYMRLGAAESFSGPIARGDIATVRKHLKVLDKIPEARTVYVALARAALRDLPAKNRATLKKLLKR